MGIQDDIFEEFFKKLEEDEKIPDTIIEELKNLWENGEVVSQKKSLK